MRHLTAFGALAAALAFSAPLAAEDMSARPQAASVVPGPAAPPMSAEDLVTLPRLGAPAVNKEGTLAVYSVTMTDPASLKRAPTHYLIDLPSRAARRLRWRCRSRVRISHSGRTGRSISSAARAPMPPPRR